MRFANDLVDDLLDRGTGGKTQTANLWNAVMHELRFPGRVKVDEEAKCPGAVLTRVRTAPGDPLYDRPSNSRSSGKKPGKSDCHP
jgi:hypothetical protein